MGVYTVRTNGEPFALAEPDKVTVVGSGNILADDSDATYVTSHSIHAPFTSETLSGIVAAPLPAVPAEILAAAAATPIGFSARAEITNTEGASRQLFFYLDTVAAWPFTAMQLGPVFPPDEIVTVDYPTWGSMTLTPDVSAALEAGTAHLMFSGPSVTSLVDTADGALFEFTLYINFPEPNVPARRLYPRTDDLGFGIGRFYPPPDTQQHGRRFGSSSPL